MISNYQVSSRTPGGDVTNGMSSSGFYSELTTRGTTQLHDQKQSQTAYPTAMPPSIGSKSAGQSTQPSLTSLWGKPAVETSRRRTLPNTMQPTLRRSRTAPTVPEGDLLRELVFVLNGVGGDLIKYDPLTDAFRLAPNCLVHPGDRDCVQRIAECGWLHDRIRQFVNRVQQDRLAGPVAQSLAAGVHENLVEYHRLIATLESQLSSDPNNRDGDSNDFTAPSFQSHDSIPGINGRLDPDSSLISAVPDEMAAFSLASRSKPQRQYLTLTRMALWTQEPRVRLRILASLCDVCQTLKGGGLASEVFAYAEHGDPEIVGMIRHLLSTVSSTLLHQINQWIYEGQLDDTCQEFFVACDPAVKKERLWHDKYSLRRPMIPSFITQTQAGKILLAGKSINFLQYVCAGKQNHKDRDVIQTARLQRVESMFEQHIDNSFDKMVSTVYQQTSRYLLETLVDRYHFLEHLRATRQFLLLGQGDFIEHLMDLLDTELNRPAAQLLTHQLSSTLESAIRATNAQYEQPEILQRLTVRLLDMSTGDTGWDVFSLDYHVDGPLATIFTDDCRLMYLRAFNFLWRAKRMEFILSALWKQQFILARLGHGLEADLKPVVHLSELLGAELRHCVQQLQYYVNFEVLECAWHLLVKQIKAATDLDEVIESHQAFLHGVITRCLLDAPSRKLIGQLRTIFDLIVSFIQMHNELSRIVHVELAARERYTHEMMEATRRGKWGTNNLREAQEKTRCAQFVQRNVGPYQARIRILASSYREMVIQFIRMLCAHPDHSLRFLADHLNFNGHYFQGERFPSLPTVASSGTVADTNHAITSGAASSVTMQKSQPYSSSSSGNGSGFVRPREYGAGGDFRF